MSSGSTASLTSKGTSWPRSRHRGVGDLNRRQVARAHRVGHLDRHHLADVYSIARSSEDDESGASFEYEPWHETKNLLEICHDSQKQARWRNLQRGTSASARSLFRARQAQVVEAHCVGDHDARQVIEAQHVGQVSNLPT